MERDDISIELVVANISTFQRKAHTLDSERKNLYAEKMTNLLAKDPSLLRGVDARSVLTGLGRVWQPSCSQACKVSSFQVKKISTFFSHSWHASVSLKVSTIFNFFNGQAALCVGIVIACFCTACDLCGLLPPWFNPTPTSCDRFLQVWWGGCPVVAPVNAWPLLGFIVGYFLTLRWWHLFIELLPRQKLRCALKSPAGLFLDKLCIDQDDPVRKAHGIHSIGGFLLNSDEMLVLWDPTYLTRLWCVFEIAVLLALNDNAQVKFLPISVFGMEWVFVFLIWCSQLMIHLLIGSGQLDIIVGVLRHVGIPDQLILFAIVASFMYPFLALMVYGARHITRDRELLLQQVPQFTVSGAHCFDPADRTFVSEIVSELYGSEGAFEEFARHELRRMSEHRLGPSLSVSYWYAMRVTSPLFVWGSLTVPMMIDAAPSVRFQRAGDYCIIWAQLPLIVKAIDKLCRSLPLGSSRYEALIASTMGVMMAVVTGAWACQTSLLISTQSSLLKSSLAVIGFVVVISSYGFRALVRSPIQS